MKKPLVFLLVLIIVAVFATGCITGGYDNLKSTGTTGTPAPTGDLSVSGTATPPPFATGDHYLEKSYSFHSDSDIYTEQLRIDDPSWAISFTVVPLNDDPQYCWFEMTVTNPDSRKSQTYGFGRTYAYDTFQQYPMYTTGPYTIQMKGNRVKVNLDVAKRLP